MIGLRAIRSKGFRWQHGSNPTPPAIAFNLRLWEGKSESGCEPPQPAMLGQVRRDAGSLC